MATKKEMKQELIDQYGYEEKDLKNDKGLDLNNNVLEDMLAKAKSDEETEKKEPNDEPTEEKVEEKEDLFTVDESLAYGSRKIEDDEIILCMSGVSGNLVVISELSNRRREAKEFGQILKIPFSDLSYIHNSSHEAFEQGKIIVLNKEVQEEFGLTDVYRNVITPKNIDKVLQLEASELKTFLKTMPKGMKDVLFERARKLYDMNKLNDRNVTDVIENEFKISLTDGIQTEDRIQVEDE